MSITLPDKWCNSGQSAIIMPVFFYQQKKNMGWPKAMDDRQVVQDRGLAACIDYCLIDWSKIVRQCVASNFIQRQFDKTKSWQIKWVTCHFPYSLVLNESHIASTCSNHQANPQPHHATYGTGSHYAGPFYKVWCSSHTHRSQHNSGPTSPITPRPTTLMDHMYPHDLITFTHWQRNCLLPSMATTPWLMQLPNCL